MENAPYELFAKRLPPRIFLDTGRNRMVDAMGTQRTQTGPHRAALVSPTLSAR